MTLELSEFRTFALANMMVPEEILAETYTAHVEGRSDYALFDGGAHKAFHTKRMIALPGCQRVYAVEADPFMAEACRDILSKQPDGGGDRVIFIEKALQNDPEAKSISWKSSPSHVGRSSIVSNNPEKSTIWTTVTEMEYREEMSVKATTIDKVLQKEPLPLPFLKLDLEGADLLALTGAEHTLKHKRPIVAFENSIRAPEVHGFTLEEMAAYFERLDYIPMNFIGDPIGPDNWFGFFEAWAAPREDAEWLSRMVKKSIAKHMPQS